VIPDALQDLVESISTFKTFFGSAFLRKHRVVSAPVCRLHSQALTCDLAHAAETAEAVCDTLLGFVPDSTPTGGNCVSLLTPNQGDLSIVLHLFSPTSMGIKFYKHLSLCSVSAGAVV
jgi:hypothetical protein